MLAAKPEADGLQITINTTEDCNLRCKYCYEINKRNITIPLEYAKKFIDIILTDPDPVNLTIDDDALFDTNLYQHGIVFDFIGGDSLMNVDILDDIFTYIEYKLNTTDNENCKIWRRKHRFSISSNGTLFINPKVAAFCKKWSPTLAVGVSIDGCPAIHDKNRIMLARGPNGEELGSMQYILEGLDFWREVFPSEADTTKATMSRETIPYLYESLVYMHETLGLTNILQNFIMEDAGCTDEDYIEFDNQMRKCVEYTLEHCDEMYWRMLDKITFADHHRSEGEDWNCKGQCGSGAMPCLGINGNIYPCFRWAPHTQSKDNPEPMVVGNINDGLSHKEVFKKVRQGAYRCNCTRETKCINCEYESACSYCIGGCFAEFQDFIRTTYICEITKIQCKWAKVYWNEYNKLKGLPMEYPSEFQLDSVKPWSK